MDYSIIDLEWNQPTIPKKRRAGLIGEIIQIGDISLELCGGPHVKNTSELGHFKIKKEEASSAGVRRIKAILEIG